jgi:triacylglycerol lipase
MIPISNHTERPDYDVTVAMARASIDAYAGPEHTERLKHEWQANEATLIVVGDTEALLLVSDDCAILSFRGTSSGADARTDMSATRARWLSTNVHAGFCEAWLSIRPGIVAALQGKLLLGQTLYVTGHSLGAALATLCACDFAGGRYAGRTVLYTFGSPRVGDWRFAALCRARLRGQHWRFVHSNDGVTRVPRLFRASFLLPKWFPLLPTLRRYRHVGELVFLTEDGHELIRPSAWRVAIERVIGFRFDVARDHSMVNYLEAVL